MQNIAQDCVGAIMGLQQAGFDVQGKKVVMLGGGGAARAVIWGLLQHGASRVTIGARNPVKIAPLAKDFAAYGAVVTAEWHSEPSTTAYIVTASRVTTSSSDST